MNHCLLEIVACPVCNGRLYYNKDKLELICKADALAYPVRDSIPVLLEDEARKVHADEITQ
ncbi:MAG: Trm112 family protein [Candidatus Malihini olakiniferum]